VITVRDATADDAPDVARLLGQLGYPSTAQEVTARLGTWSVDPDGRVLAAVEPTGAVVGCLSVHAIPYFEKTGRWARVVSLVVDDRARRSGVGTALMRAAEDTARHWGCRTVEVTSHRARHDAHAFYQRLGYVDGCAESGRFLKPLA
jgi:GNAT superfamily N-acetyltransferase